MFIWAIIEPCLEILSVLFVFTQIIIPAIRDRPIFPMFRKSNKRLKNAEKKLQDIRVLKDVDKVESEVHRQQRELKKGEKTNE